MSDLERIAAFIRRHPPITAEAYRGYVLATSETVTSDGRLSHRHACLRSMAEARDWLGY